MEEFDGITWLVLCALRKGALFLVITIGRIQKFFAKKRRSFSFCVEYIPYIEKTLTGFKLCVKIKFTAEVI